MTDNPFKALITTGCIFQFLLVVLVATMAVATRSWFAVLVAALTVAVHVATVAYVVHNQKK